MIITKKFDTSLGLMVVGVFNDQLCLFDFEHRNKMQGIKSRISAFLDCGFEEGEHVLFDELDKQFKAYCAGEISEFNLPLLFTGTDFQIRVWQALLDIPYGETRTYMEQTKILGNEKAIRAVARANGENCLAIVVPCHRVIGANGSLTGYAGGVKTKKWLLDHEAQHSGKTRQYSLF